MKGSKRYSRLIAVSVVLGLAIGSAYGLHAGFKVRSIIISDAVTLIVVYALYRLMIYKSSDKNTEPT